MSHMITPTQSRSSEAQKLIHAEVEVIRQRGELAGDPETLLLLDLLQEHKQGSDISLAIALQISAHIAVAAGLNKRQWVQQLLSRHACDDARVHKLWRALVEMHTTGELPWAA
jgi:hypothetical protein